MRGVGKRLVVLGIAGAFAAACSDSDTGESGDKDGAAIETSGDSGGGGDGDGPDVPDDADAVTADADAGPDPDAGLDLPDNSPIGDSGYWDADTPDSEPGAGEFLAPCGSNGDCNSGWCVPGPNGKVCSKTCLEECPAPGWECRGQTDGEGNPVFLCVSLTLNLCRPCAQNKDCNAQVSNAPNLCLAAGDEGSFCGINCGSLGGIECPAGYVCEEIAGASNAARFQCVPSGGAVCECNGWAIEQGAQTACHTANAFGACPGTRFCDAGGLTDCSGVEPVAESCNGADDNCDGNVDEGVVGGSCALTNEHGTCPGTLSCGPDATETCVGKAPAPETCNGVDDDCNGVTDDGEPDFDGDGIADCVDPDDDDDGTPDPEDCEPKNAEVHLGAQEVCDGDDDNCNGLVDEEGATGCEDWWQDADGDTYGSAAKGPKCLCAPNPNTYYTVKNGDDCNDLVATANPTGTETCNGVDDDCNGVVDDGLGEQPCSISNGVGTCQGVQLCVGGSVTCLGPVPKPEVCNGFDDDCNGIVDDTTLDTDGDGDPDCTDPDDDDDGVADEADCEPKNATAFPGANEQCDGLDTNCNGLVDDPGAVGCEPFYQDADQDGYGSVAVPSKCLCGPDGFTYFNTKDNSDCNDIDAAIAPNAAEVCNGVDDDCDGQTDEGVASPCGTCESVCVIDVGDGGDEAIEPTPDNSSGLTPNPDGGVSLDTSTSEIKFIWVANSAEDTVSKLNTETGCEVARYNVCVNPSRTAVDNFGNGIITCRGDGRVAKVSVFEQDCVDFNGNGQIDTSVDTNADCEIAASEMVAGDECVLWNVQPDGTNPSGCGTTGTGCARAAGVDSDGNVWVGMWNSTRLHHLNGQTGATIKTVDITGRPYGLAIDNKQTVWVVSRDPHILMKVDQELGEVDSWGLPFGNGYGMAVDGEGNVWAAAGTNGGVMRFNTQTETFDWQYDPTSGDIPFRGYSRGVAVSVQRDAQGQLVASKIYLAHHTWDGACTANVGQHRYVTVIDALTGAEEAPIDLGADRGAVGVAIDSSNNLWTVNQCDSSATKADTATKAVLGHYPVGLQPYTYSDMTGYALKTITSPNGYFRKVFSGWVGSQTKWDKIIVDADLPGNGATRVDLRYRTADQFDQLALQPWTGPVGPFPPATFPYDMPDVQANFIEVEVSLITDDPTLIPTLHTITMIAYEVTP